MTNHNFEPKPSWFAFQPLMVRAGILAFASVLVQYALYYSGMLSSQILSSIHWVGILVLFIFLGIALCKDLNPTHADFNPVWRNLAHLGIMIVVFVLITGVFDYILFGMIDPVFLPALYQQIKDETIEKYGAQLSEADLDKMADRFDEMIKTARDLTLKSTLLYRFMGYGISGMLAFLIVGIVSANKYKKRKTEAIDIFE